MSRRLRTVVSIAVVLLTAVVVFVVARQPVGAPGNNQVIPAGTSQAQLQAQAIAEAKAYRTDDNCTSALTPATHPASGARYTFPSGCLAPGWVADR